MYEFKNLTRLTLVATVLLVTYATFNILAASAALVQGPAGPDAFRITEWLQSFTFLVLLACLIAVGRWIYRASENAHAFGSEMTISPGWAVGWYFVPFANLVKPFHAMREIWLASHESDGSYEERVPILNWWWGLWITTNILENVAWRLGELGVGPTIDMVAAVLNIALCLVLILIMREIDSSQRYARHAVTFA